MTIEEFAIALAGCETESAVISLLKRVNLWDNEKNWRPFGDNENNFSVIGNQQSSADTALVEKIINSIDAVLLKECLIRNIDPEGPSAPKTIKDAVHDFFQVPDGSLTKLSPPERNTLSKNIILASSGAKKGEVNYTLVDRGEGQTPKRMIETILSISRNNKLRIPFVQGKFNMGGTGALTFSGHNGFNVIISKRCPQIPNDSNDITYNKWSVTVVRKEAPREGRKSSMYTYLTREDGDLFQFSAGSLPIIPTSSGGKKDNMLFGTFIKMFNYTIPSCKSMSTTDLYYRLNTLIPNLALPVRIVESRDYSGHTLENTLSGLNVRLEEDKSENIEPSFPIGTEFTVDGQLFKCTIYLFKKKNTKETSRTYRNKEGILYTVNGQTHATEGEGFFAQQKVGLSYLQESLLVIVDCSNVDVAHSEELFMTSRDRMRKNAFTGRIKEQIVEILKSNPGIREAANKRKEEMTRNKLSNNQPFVDALQDALKSSPVLSKLLIEGSEIQAPYNTSDHGGTTSEFIGKQHPTFFTLLKGKKNKPVHKSVPINQRSFQIQFTTDAVNDYFSREIDPGELTVRRMEDGSIVHPKSVNIFNGIATVSFFLPRNYPIGASEKLRVEVQDPFEIEPYVNEFEYSVEKERQTSPTGTTGKRRSAPDKGNGSEPSRGLAIPDLIEVSSKEWDDFGMDSTSSVMIREDAEGKVQMFINIDNKYLQTELKSIKRDPSKTELLKAKYRCGMGLITMAVQSYYINDEEVDVPKEVSTTTKLMAPFLIPLLNTVENL